MKKWLCVILAVGMLFLGSLAVYADVVNGQTASDNTICTRPEPDEEF